MATITYIPQTLAFIESNLPVVENGHIIAETAKSTPVIITLICDCVTWLVKNVVVLICDYGTELDPVFALVAILGIFCIMAGFRKIGTKMTSTSFFGYIVCKVVSEIAK